MKLSELLRGAGVISRFPENAGEMEIAGVSSDSRTVRPGYAFVCLKGSRTDGESYIAEAILAGASVCVVSRGNKLPENFPRVTVADTRRALAFIWNNYYLSPADKLPVIAVTGTCGKTSVAFMLKHIYSEAGLSAGLMGTVRSMIGDAEIPSDCQSEIYNAPCAMTTPDPKYLYRNLRLMCDAGCDIAVMEASSHALSQHKLDPITPRLAVFTNLSPEHLDYHMNMESYLRAKAKLFSLSPRGVLNGDDPAAERIAAYAPECEMTVVSSCGKGDYRVEDIRLDGMNGVSYTLCSPYGKIKIELPVPGRFSVENSSLAAAAALETGVSPEAVCRALKTMPGIEGRMEKIYSGDFCVIRDFAHTASALESVLKTVRRSTEGRVITVFGCGGDRDKSKRAPMGECATRLSDLTVITSDNSRTENPIDIIEQILRGVHKEKEYTVVPDRREAIEFALGTARAGDTVMLCGKGHENYEIDRRGKHPFDEKEVARAFLKKNCQNRDKY